MKFLTRGSGLIVSGVVALFCSWSPMVDAQDEANAYILPEDVPVNALEARAAFESLSAKEKQYAHWMSEASWIGSQIVFRQVSAESPAILEMFQRVFSKNRIELRKAVNRAGVSDREFEWLKQYAASFYSHMGNYSSFGDAKFLPRISPEKFALCVRAAAGLDPEGDPRLLELYDHVARKIYSINPDERQLGLEGNGTSAYYSENITKAEVDLVGAYMVEKIISPYNTRVVKDEYGRLIILTASIAPSESMEGYRGKEIVIRGGDYSEILVEVVRALEKAALYAANDEQRLMIADYIKHFMSGNIDDHKNSMRHWVKDKGPVVETNLGFIESYRDPAGVRGEWEGLVAMVNKEQTKKFGVLVDQAPAFIPRLPWGKEFEKDKFHRPDFTSLEVLAFANGGIPAGINIPNYDDIRQNEGFKNVSLGNVLSARKPSQEKLSFLEDGDQDLYKKLSGPSFEVQVGLHELLGHGSGKLLEERPDGTMNFDKAVVNPATGAPVATWYKSGETWGSKFKELAATYEECRAEAVGLYLSTDPEVLKIFGHTGEEASDITYVNWLNMARAGITGLQFYDPNSKKWGQAHMHARFALLNVMLRDGDGVLKMYEKDGEWFFHLDRQKIEGPGKKAVGEFLKKLNVFKATADVEAGRKLYDQYTTVTDGDLKMRSYVIAKKKPRNIWVQPVTDVDAAGNVILREYPPTSDGVIDSFLDRFAFLVNY